MSCCSNHSHGNQNSNESHDVENPEKKTSWGTWILAALLILLLIFSAAG